MINKKIVKSFLLLEIVLLTGCWKPPRYDAIVTINTNELAYLVNLTGDDSQKAVQTAVQKKNIPIGNYWQRTGRWSFQGTWRPSSLVITVPQAPVRRDWEEDSKSKTIRMTSLESAGFIVPLTINSYIADYDDGAKYLKAFKPKAKENINWGNYEIKEWPQFLKQESQPLENALDTVVFTKITELLSPLFVKTPILYAERASKIYISAVFNGATPEQLNAKLSDIGLNIKFKSGVESIALWAKDTYGITITALAPTDGVIYDNPNVQKEIDGLSANVMKKKNLEQQEINAKKQQAIELVQAQTATKVAREKANQASALLKLQEIENSKRIAEATAKAIESGKVVPQGSFPLGLQTLIVTPNYSGFDKH